MSPDLWQRGCELLATEMPEQQFNTWIRPLMASVATEQGLIEEHDTAAVVSVRVPNRFKLDWIRAQYASRIEAVLSELAGKSVRLDLSVAPRSEAASPSPAMALRRPTGAATLAPSRGSAKRTTGSDAPPQAASASAAASMVPDGLKARSTISLGCHGSQVASAGALRFCSVYTMPRQVVLGVFATVQFAKSDEALDAIISHVDPASVLYSRRTSSLAGIPAQRN